MLSHLLQNRKVKMLFKQHQVIYDENLVFSTAEDLIQINDVSLLNPFTKEELDYSLPQQNYTLAQCALIYAYHNGQFNLFKDLFTLQENASSDLVKNLILMKAIVVGRMDIISLLMKEDKFNFNIKKSYVESCCYHIIEKKHVELLNFILTHEKEFKNYSDISIISILLKELRAITSYEKINLFISLVKNSEVNIEAKDIIDFIAKLKLSENKENSKKEQEIIFQLLESNHYGGNDLNKIMLTALKKKYFDVTIAIHQTLLQNKEVIQTNQLLGYSCDLGFLNMCHYLSQYNIDINAPYLGYWFNQDKGNPESMKPIIGAAIGHHKDIILFLIENNCQVDIKTVKSYVSNEEIIELIEKLHYKKQLEQTLITQETIKNKAKL